MLTARHHPLLSGFPSLFLAKGQIENESCRNLHKLNVESRLGPLQTRTVLFSTSADSSSASLSESSKEEDAKRYAVLHDFCMTIPYGGTVTIAGLFGIITGYGNFALAAAIVGYATCVASLFSLRAWRAGRSNSKYTLASAGLATSVGVLAWKMVQTGKGKIPGNLLMLVSLALVLFLLYNLAAGGNPPKRRH